jgi:hypothetical protein
MRTDSASTFTFQLGDHWRGAGDRDRYALRGGDCSKTVSRVRCAAKRTLSSFKYFIAELLSRMNAQSWKAVQPHRRFLFFYWAVPLLIDISRSSALAQTRTRTSAPQTNWVALATSADGAKVFAAVGTRMVAVVREPPGSVGPIFISTNSGLTWAQSSAPVTNWTQVVCSADGTLVFATSETSVYSSTNSGATWDALD